MFYHIVGTKGKAAFLLKQSAKRRRSKIQIEQDKKDEALK